MNKIQLMCFFLLLTFCTQSSFAQGKVQLKYTDAKTLTIIGKSIATANVYDRVDITKYNDLPSRVAQLLTNSAGLAIRFTTNSTTIGAKWCVGNSKISGSMTPTSHQGLDLYIKNGDLWQFAGIGKPATTCSDEIIVSRMDNSEKECLLYLPLYDVTKSIEIGIDSQAEIKAGMDPFRNKVLIYGSSIVQGTGASRPGMAYPARLSRSTGINFINLGLSGSAKMEPAVVDMVASINVDAYILDCIPNSTPVQIKERTAYLINTIRNAHPKAPIIVMQSIIREQGYWDKKLRQQVEKQNINIQKELETLLQKNVKDLYFISSINMLGTDHEGTIDGTHPNDLGYDRMLKYIQPLITDILNKYGIKSNKFN